MKKIFIVEDDKGIQDTYKRKLVPLGFTVFQAFDGKQLMENVRLEKPDLILLDIMLPGGMNGFDVLEQMKKDPELSSIPVLVFTNLEGEMETAKKIGATDYFIKANTSIDQVVEKIKLHLGQ